MSSSRAKGLNKEDRGWGGGGLDLSSSGHKPAAGFFFNTAMYLGVSYNAGNLPD